MEVLSRFKETEVQVGSGVDSDQLGGHSLIERVVSLTEIPEPLMQREMDEILALSGQSSESLTLEQLRLAMLSYLEVIQAEMGET